MSSMFESDEVCLGQHAEEFQYRLAMWFGLGFFLAYALHVIGDYTSLPRFIRLPLGGFVFCMGPGLAVFSCLSFLRPSRYPYLTLLVLSCSLGLTYNFITNLAVFAFQPSLAQAMEVYLLVAAFLYAAVFGIWIYRGRFPWKVLLHVRWPMVIGVGGALLVWSMMLERKPSMGLYVEELVILRKLFDNSSIAATNIAFHQDEYTTYFFVPFYQMLAMCAQFAGVDVLEVQHGLWPFTAAVSLLCYAAIARQLTERWATVAVVSTIGIIHGLFFTPMMSNALTVFTPFPDRYAFSAGVLVPLAFFHFLIHMADQRINVPAFVGLVYLIVEMTFIHARETLFVVGMVIVTGVIRLFERQKHLRDLTRIAILLVLIGGVLLAYRQVNLAHQPDLNRFLTHLRDDMFQQLRLGLESHGPLSILGIPQLHLGEFDSFPYQHHFPYWWHQSGLWFVPVSICLLPLYVMFVERASLLILPGTIAAFGLFSLFQGVHLLAGIVVGVPFIFDIFSILFICSVIVFADGLAMLSLFVSSPRGTRMQHMGFLGGVILAGVAWLELSVNKLSPLGFATGHLLLEIGVYVVALGCLVVRMRQLRVSGPSGSNPGGTARWGAVGPSRMTLAAGILVQARNATMTAAVLAALLMVPAIWTAVEASEAKAGWLNVAGSHAGRTDRSVAALYNDLDRQRLFHVAPESSWRLPAVIVSYIRHDVPELQTWFGGHTLPVLIVGNQYAPVLSINGQLNPGFFANALFVEKIEGEERARAFRKGAERMELSDITSLLVMKPDTGSQLELLDAYGVEWIITRPAEAEALDRILRVQPEYARAFELRIEAEGYRIYRFHPVGEGAPTS